MSQATFSIVNIGYPGANKFWGETERVRQAAATCTLIRLGGANVLVDPSPHPESLQALLRQTTGLMPEAIDWVFITHHHADHRYGISLFPGRPVLMAAAEQETWRERNPDDEAAIARFEAAEGRLPQGIQLVPTPGHTMTHHSLAFDSVWGRTLVAGDAVMTWDHYCREEGHTNSMDFEAASETIRRIKAEYDIIVPGHSNYFPTLRR
jgi:glyoxylase-like metal-dependent hydrolase (beta-lactamase superfamily II)